MAKKTTPRSFVGLAKRASKAPVNSGIFSNSGKMQKVDPQPKASTGKKADLSLLREAVDNRSIKYAGHNRGGIRDPKKLQDYALK